MTAIDLLNSLTKQAARFRQDQAYFARNAHMPRLSAAPPQDCVDAVLVGFINHVAGAQGIDYALTAGDLEKIVR
ncbi:MAG: hypothetical protein ACRCZI_11170 [Cetobacterium sp.]